MGKKGDYLIPFAKGQMMEYVHCREGEVADSPGGRFWGMPTEWRKNEPFSAELELVGHYRGRSAARVRVRNKANGELYSMGFGAFYDAVEACGAKIGGHLTGVWAFRKQGSNYGLVVV